MQAAPLDFGNYSLNTILVPALVGWALEKAQRSHMRIFDWISHETPGLVRAFSVVFAALTAAGMTVQWINAETGWSLTIAGPGTILAFLVSFARNLVTQEFARHTVAVRADQKEILKKLDQAN